MIKYATITILLLLGGFLSFTTLPQKRVWSNVFITKNFQSSNKSFSFYRPPQRLKPLSNVFDTGPLKTKPRLDSVAIGPDVPLIWLLPINLQ